MSIAKILGTGLLAAGGFYLFRRGTGLQEMKANLTTTYNIGYGSGGIRIRNIRVTNQSRGSITINTPQVRLFSNQQAYEENKPFASSELSGNKEYKIEPLSTIPLSDITIRIRVMDIIRELGTGLANGRIAILVQTLIPVSILGLRDVVKTLEPKEVSLSNFL